MADPEPTTPRHLTFDADVMAGLAAPWPRWPRAGAPRPFDLDACLARAARMRPGGEVSAELEEVLPARDGVLSRAEAAFWFSVLIDEDFSRQHAHRRAWARRCFAEFGEDPDLEDVLRVVKKDLYDASLRAHAVPLMRALRALAPWHRIVETYVEDVRAHRAGRMLRHLGYCPEDERDAAAEFMRAATAEYTDDQWRELGLFELHLNLPLPDVADAALAAAEAQEELSDFRGVYEVAMFTTDHARLDALVHTRPFAWTARHLQIYLARRGTGDLDAMLEAVMKPRRAWPPRPALETLQALAHVKAPEVVSRLHPHAALGGDAAAAAAAILEAAAPDHAALGLIASCARAGKRRTWAIGQLRELAARDGGRDAIEAALPQQREKLAEFVRAEVLEHVDDVSFLPLDGAPDWIRHLANLGERKVAPPWLVPDDLPDVVLADSGLALPPPCTAGLVIADADRHERPAADAARALLTEESLAALSLALINQWVDAPLIVPDGQRADVEHARAAEWVARHPSPASIDALEGYVRASRLPRRRKDREPIVTRAAALLGSIDAPEALAATLRLTRGRGLMSTRAAAEAALSARQDDLGVTRAQLEDLAVPSFGLDALGRRDFDYGARTVRMFVAGGELLFEDLSRDKVFKNPPRGLKSDDVDKAAAARAVFDVTVKPIRAALTDQSIRLAEAMLTGRVWPGRWWRDRVLTHPILGPMARGLVWARRRGDDVTTLRPTEDGGLVDLNFDEHAIEDDDTITLPHPLDLDAGVVTAWTQHMFEFEIVQPFDQLARRTYTPEDALARAHAFAEGAFMLDPRALARLAKDGPEGFANAGHWTTASWTFVARGAPVHLWLAAAPAASNKNAPRAFEALYRRGDLLAPEDLTPLERSELARILDAAAVGE